MHKEFTDKRPSSRQEIVNLAHFYSLSVHYRKAFSFYKWDRLSLYLYLDVGHGEALIISSWNLEKGSVEVLGHSAMLPASTPVYMALYQKY